MNDDETGTTYGADYGWSKQENGTYTKSMIIYYKNGKNDYVVLEENVSEKEYFKRKLDGTA